MLHHVPIFDNKTLTRYQSCLSQSFSNEHHIDGLPPRIVRRQTTRLFMVLNEIKECFTLQWWFLIADILSWSAWCYAIVRSIVQPRTSSQQKSRYQLHPAQNWWGQKCQQTAILTLSFRSSLTSTMFLNIRLLYAARNIDGSIIQGLHCTTSTPR